MTGLHSPGDVLFDPLAPGAKDARATQIQKGRFHNGTWRANHGFDSSHGVRITMSREHGITKGEVLLVPFRFQVPAMNDLQRPYEYNWSTYDTIRVGQRSRPMGRQLMQLQVDTMLLDQPATDAATGAVVWRGSPPDPQKSIAELRWIMGITQGSQPEIFRLVLAQPAVWGNTPIINMLATLTALQPLQKQDEVGTEYLSATFLEWGPDEEIQRKQRPVSHGKTKWKLKQGDTLYEIAKKSHWHRASAWRTVAKANGIKGVAPSSAAELAAWAKKHHKKELTIPAKGRS
jgi:hypothetical protein